MELDSRAQNNLKTSPPVDLFPPTERFNNAMPAHTAVLVTGMSGVGKTTALDELARRGYTTVDTDDAHWIDIVDGEPLWREPLINDLLSRPRQTPIFIQAPSPTRAPFTMLRRDRSAQRTA